MNGYSGCEGYGISRWGPEVRGRLMQEFKHAREQWVMQTWVRIFVQ